MSSQSDLTISIRFGATVRQLRTARQYSQEELAERADLNRSYIGEIERGQVVPSLTTLEKIASALLVKPSELLGECEK